MKKRKWLAIAVCIIMLLGMMPTTVFADGTADIAPEVPTKQLITTLVHQANGTRYWNQVTVDCDADNDIHHRKGYTLDDGDYKIGKVTMAEDGVYTCTLTIDAEKFVDKYNAESGKIHHLLGNEPESRELTLRWESDGFKNQWKFDNENPYVLFEVTCVNAPTDDAIADLGIWADAHCSMHSKCESAAACMQLKAGDYTIGDVTRTENGEYTCALTIHAKRFVNFWNENHANTYGKHYLVDESNKVVTLHWSKEDGKWTVENKDEYVLFEIAGQPTGAELIQLGGLAAVKCDSNDAHITYSYQLSKGDYTLGGVTRTEDGKYTCTLNITADRFVEMYCGGEHRLIDGEASSKDLTLSWDKKNQKWIVEVDPETGRKDALFNVTCVKAPTEKEIAEAGAMYAEVTCVNGDKHGYTTLQVLPGEYSVGEVQLGQDGKYTCTLTIAASGLLDRFSKEEYDGEQKGSHQLASGESSTKTLTLVWDASEGKWKWKDDKKKISFDVTCASSEPPATTPAAPTDEQLKALDSAVLVKCVDDETQKHTHAYKLLGEINEDYFVGSVKKNDAGEWLCDISFTPKKYVSEFNKELPGHVQNEKKLTPITLRFQKGVWTVMTQGRVEVKEGTTPPTPDDKFYTVTYEDGRSGSFFKDQVYKVKSGSATPAYQENGKATAPTHTNYYFTGWSPEVAETVTEDVTYTAQWESKAERFIKEQLKGNIQVECIDGTNHAIMKYDTSVGGFRAVTLEDRDHNFTSTITISAKGYVEQYNTEPKTTHKLASGESEEKTIVVTFDKNYGNFKVVEGQLPVIFKVTEKTGTVTPPATSGSHHSSSSTHPLTIKKDVIGLKNIPDGYKVMVNISKNGTLLKTVELNKANKYSITEYLSSGTYTLAETASEVEGYKLSDQKFSANDFTLTYGGKTVTITNTYTEVKDEPVIDKPDKTNKPDKPNKHDKPAKTKPAKANDNPYNVPKTGDNLPISLTIYGIIAAGALLGIRKATKRAAK